MTDTEVINQAWKAYRGVIEPARRKLREEIATDRWESILIHNQTLDNFGRAIKEAENAYNQVLGAARAERGNDNDVKK